MDQKLMDRIRELEKKRAAGISVPELDALYMKVDQIEQRAYDDYRSPKPASAAMPASAPASAPSSAPKRMAKGGTASSRADGIAQRGKTKGRIC
jgi:hypothetical protein